MMRKVIGGNKLLEEFFIGKSEHTRTLFDHFIGEYQEIGSVTVQPAKTMIGIATRRKRIAYVTQLGKDFIHIVFPFDRPYPENLCFQRISRVPGKEKQFNHHFRMFSVADLNKEVLAFMKLAHRGGA